MQTPPTEPASDDFMTFMRAYQDMVYSTAVRLTGHDGQAEDIAQEVFLRAYEHFSHLAASPGAGGWLKTVTTNLTLNYLSRYRKRRRLFSEMSADEQGSSDPPVDLPLDDTVPAELGEAQRRAIVEQAVSGLPRDQRVALVLYHFEDLPYQQIADRLEVSLSKVKTDIRRARASLLAALTARGLSRETL